MANNADEVQLMAAAAQKNNVLLMEAYHNLYHPMVQRIKELCKKEMDQIKHIETTMYNCSACAGCDAVFLTGVTPQYAALSRSSADRISGTTMP